LTGRSLHLPTVIDAKAVCSRSVARSAEPRSGGVCADPVERGHLIANGFLPDSGARAPRDGRSDQLGRLQLGEVPHARKLDERRVGESLGPAAGGGEREERVAVCEQHGHTGSDVALMTAAAMLWAAVHGLATLVIDGPLPIAMARDLAERLASAPLWLGAPPPDRGSATD
jgi:hypothetical protein